MKLLSLQCTKHTKSESHTQTILMFDSWLDITTRVIGHTLEAERTHQGVTYYTVQFFGSFLLPFFLPPLPPWPTAHSVCCLPSCLVSSLTMSPQRAFSYIVEFAWDTQKQGYINLHSRQDKHHPLRVGCPWAFIGLLPSRQGHHLFHFQRTLKRGKEKKKGMRFSQDLNLHLLNGGQMFLPSEPLKLWQWSRGYMIYIQRYNLNDLFWWQPLNHT